MKKIFWGLFFLVAGASVIVNQLGYTDINLFSLLCTIIIIPIFITSLIKLRFAGMLFSLAFLAIIYQELLGIESITPWPVLLAALFGSIGLSIIFNRTHIYKKYYHCGPRHHHCEETVEKVDDDEVDLQVSFGSSIKYINSDDFKKANLSSSFGSLKVYFDNARIKKDNATIRLDVSFSGVELYIPKEWKIISKVDATLGSIDFKNVNQTETKKTVMLTGKVSLSGVEIFYV
ncbi:MAG: LiaF domain-containing protein [Bacilli bacterium]